jgi:hypothetical protein
MSRPILIHSHIPKTAGTSVRIAMRGAFGDRHRDAYTGVQGRAFTQRELDRVAAGPPPADSLSSHAIRDFPPSVDGREPIYFCFVRDPLGQFLSYVRYVRDAFETLTQTHRGVLPPRTDAMSEEDLAAWLLDQGSRVPFSGAFNVRFLTPGDERDDTARLHDAAGKLRRMAMIGRSRNVDGALAALEQVCRERGLDVRFPRGVRENVSPVRGTPGWIDEGTPLRDRFEARYAPDRALLAGVADRLSPGP